ncbi:MAG: ChaN family lipoprotein [Planctomycetota bacterium]
MAPNRALRLAALLALSAALPSQDGAQSLQAQSPRAQSPRAQSPRALPSLEAATRIWDSAAGAELEWPALLDALAAHDVVFLGETHIDDTTHRVELHVLEELLARKDGKVVLSMEMFERDVQDVLDAYLQGRIDEAAFVRDARAWGNYRTGYRPLIELAKARGIPVVAANFPGLLRRKLARGGKAAIDALAPADRALLPADIFPASDAYWERVERAVRGHMGFGAASTPEERLYDSQNLWDNAMGDNVARARAAHPDHLVLHVAGGFHVAWRDGTVAQFLRRDPGARTAVVSVQPSSAPALAQPRRDADEADYLVYADAVARGPFEGTYAVSVAAELRYRLHLPDGAETRAAADLPLLVWLPDGDVRPEDALALWRNAIGADAAIAVVEHPFPQRQDDLGGGGSWHSGDGFRADYGRTQLGLVRIVEYLTRRMPIDPSRVLIAGRGAGGAVVLWAALYSSWLEGELLAFDPGDLTRLSMEALPDRPPTMARLTVARAAADATRLEKVVADYRSVGAEATVVEVDAELAARIGLVRERLGLPPLATDPARPVWLALERDAPRARQWAEIRAAKLLAGGATVRVVPAAQLADAPADAVQRLAVGGAGLWSMDSFADGSGLPLAGGSFGGTTVVVLPAGAGDDELAAWRDLEQKRAIKRRSMFANLAVARLDGAPTLPTVLADLRKRGRNRVLLVPAEFCADVATMRAIEQALGAAADGMELLWLPGLGAELVR